MSVYWTKSHKHDMSKADTCLKRTIILVPMVSASGSFHWGHSCPADPGEGGRNSDVQLLFECDYIVLSGGRGEGGSSNPGFSRTSFVNGPFRTQKVIKMPVIDNIYLNISQVLKLKFVKTNKPNKVRGVGKNSKN